MDKEFILCAAVNYNGHIVCDRLLQALLNIDYTLTPGREHQGFLTSLNRFVNRKEAWKIAKLNNQIRFGLVASDNGDDSELISENLY
jgi:hypothetical protein